MLNHLSLCGIPVAVVTGSDRQAAERNVQGLFPESSPVLVSGSDVQRGKPDPLPFLAALEKLRIGESSQCLVVENAPLGVEAAVGASLPVWGFLSDSPLEPRELKAVGALRVFGTHQDLLTAIQTLRYDELRQPLSDRLQPARLARG